MNKFTEEEILRAAVSLKALPKYKSVPIEDLFEPACEVLQQYRNHKIHQHIENTRRRTFAWGARYVTGEKRTDRSVAKLEKFLEGKAGVVTLSDGEKVPITRRDGRLSKEYFDVVKDFYDAIVKKS